MRATTKVLTSFVALGIGMLWGCSNDANQQVVVPEGTTFTVSTDQPLSTRTNRSGDPFEATIREALVIDGKIAIPADATVRGTLTNLEGAGRVHGRAKMTLSFQEVINPDGIVQALYATPIHLEAASGTKDDAEKIAAGGIAGALIGGIAGGGKGAAIGTIVGAGTGAAVVLATKGDELDLPRGQVIVVELSEPVSLIAYDDRPTRDEQEEQEG